ncbi:hybrid sensor histidine kinase/response regulator [Pelagicoccus mobilis]|uniref:histidine kinase n=1 Tax=Pelagicoccus mobilis TaxID=415221 RepID=A0A934RWX6_9BACT|nr:PAS domain-containing sensor histidine kinase [Pelagicoccus mobilis]MBK1876719.1 PAS domain-containing protein [Pelagicoccus mobilis]
MLSESHSNNTQRPLDSRLPAESEPAGRTRLSEDTQQNESCHAPALDWTFFSRLSTPGENAAYSLHNGTLAFLESDANVDRVWGLAAGQSKVVNLSLLVTDGAALKSWLLNLDPQAEASEFRTTLADPASAGQALLLKAIPLFIAPDPEQTRVVLKAVPATDGPSQSKAFPVNLNLSSSHEFDGSFLTASASWAELLGLEIEQLRDLKLKEIVVPSDADRLAQLLQDASQEDTVKSSIVRFQAETNRVKTVLLSARRDNGQSRLVVEGKNMTVEGNNPAMDLLKTSVELVKESVLLLMRVGPSFRICFANRAFEHMTGYRYSRVAGSSLACLHGPKTNARAILEIEESLQNQAEHTANLLLYRKSGDAFWANTYLTPLRDEFGVANYFAVILEDATEVRNVSDELAKKNLELNSALSDLKQTQKTLVQQESLRALGQMASGIAHDFNNLLAPILGFSELLLTVPQTMQDKSKLTSYLKKIQVAAQDGAAVVSRLREFYRSQNSPEEFIQILPDELLWQVKELTRHRWKNQAEAKGLNIDFQMSMASARPIMGNEPELRQVFTNLIINAVDAMKDHGDITVSVSDRGDNVRIEIADSGCGMNEETRLKCLEPFYTTKGKLGTGLGLSIVFGVVQRHHGTFDIESQEGVGTRIIMEFPAVKQAFKEEIDVNETGETKSLRIMLVDDEEVLLEVISELLASGGHTVDVFGDPNRAIDAFKSKNYDLVITDRAMPLMSGDQLAAAVKRAAPDTPIYMITGFGDMINDSGEKPEHIDEVLGKPVPLDVLNRKLAEIAAKK